MPFFRIALVGLIYIAAFQSTAQAHKVLKKVPDYALKEWNDLKGPAAASVFRFAQGRIVDCETFKRDTRCALAAIAAKVFLYHSDDSEKPAYALAFIMYAPTTGNMVLSEARVFARQPDGTYKASAEIANLIGGPESAVPEGNGFKVVMLTAKPEDAHCCPTGRATWRVDPQTPKATFISGYKPR